MALRGFSAALIGVLVAAAPLTTALGQTVPGPAAAAPSGKPYVDDLLDQAAALINSTGAKRDMDLAVALLREAVRANNSTAMRKLAGILLMGDGVPADPPRAEALLKQAIAAGDVWGAASELGDLYRTSAPLKSAPNAVIAYQQAVDAGNTGAMSKLAAILATGADGVPADPARAEALLKMAVASGDTKWAAGDLGDFYRLDTSLKSTERAIAAYQQASDSGNRDATEKLATIFLKGDGNVPADLTKAEALLKQAVVAGDANWAAAQLGDLYRSDGPLKNASKAATSYEQSAQAGNVSSMLRLSSMLTDGAQVPLDLNKAKTWLEAALAAGSTSDAAYSLGLLYLRADFAARNVTTARGYYEQASKVGNVSAHLAIVALASANITVSADLTSAIDHARKAADALGRDRVLDDLLRLPTASVIALVQQQLAAGGEPITPDGKLGTQTKAAIDRFCKAKAVTDCDSRLITRPFLDAVIFNPNVKR